ncbi:acyl-CoA thioesterase [Acidisoma sp. 7E03]
MGSPAVAIREPLIRVIAMPADTNPSGDIFGGWLLSQMDLAAGNLAHRIAKGRCVTVAVDAMAFLAPVHVGDEVSVYADLLSMGRTSMKITVEAERRTRFQTETVRVTTAVFTFVAIDEDRKPRPIEQGPPA